MELDVLTESPSSPAPRSSDGPLRLVAGGICEDETLLIDELTPGIKHAVASRIESIGGGAANVAAALAALAPERGVALVAQTGDDRLGGELRAAMAARGVDMPLAAVRGGVTSQSTVVVDAAGQSTPLCSPGVRAVPLPLKMIDLLLPRAEACCVVSHAVTNQLGAVLRLANARRVPIYLGLSRDQIRLGYDQVDLEIRAGDGAAAVIVNADEARDLTGRTQLGEQLKRLRFDELVWMAVITRGVDGIDALAGDCRVHVDAYRDRRCVVDTTTAGDAAFAALVDALARQLPLELALEAAARNGFEACTRHGLGTLSRDEMDRYLAGLEGRRAA
jgi:sugar/nucleoside kinase (ribokinase family)